MVPNFVKSRMPFVIFFVLLMLSCGKPRDNREQRGMSGKGGSATVSGGTLVIGIRSEPETLNPLGALSQSSRNIIGQIFSRLADINADLITFTPRLAKSWEFSNNQRRITFHLRTDVRWHDGEPFTAQDVLFTYKLHVHPEVAWDGISYKQSISNVTAPNDSTVIFSFNSKSRTMLMDAVEGYIVPKHILENVAPKDIFTASFNQSPVGTGPFQFLKWIDFQNITLIKNTAYFYTGKPYLDRLIFQIVPDNFNLLNQLKSGDIDLIEGIYPKDFLNITRDWENGKSAIRPISYLGRRYDFIGWNMVDPESYAIAVKNGRNTKAINQFIKPNRYFGDQRVRAALTMALDRDAILNTVTFGAAVPLHGPVAPILPAYNEPANIIWPYDPDKAEQFLTDAGWVDRDGDGIREKNNIPFEFEITTLGGNIQWEQVATIVQDQLLSVGVRATLRFVEPALLFGKMLPEKDFDAVIIGWNVGLTADFTPLFHSRTFFTPFHFNGYFSAEYDSLDDAVSRTTTEEEAAPFYDEIARLLSYELPYTWLYYRQECSAVHRRFKNIRADKRGMFINLEEWWIPENERIDIDRAFAQ
jgi:peptide/nickel transport system substrate-binding protein